MTHTASRTDTSASHLPAPEGVVPAPGRPRVAAGPGRPPARGGQPALVAKGRP